MHKKKDYCKFIPCIVVVCYLVMWFIVQVSIRKFYGADETYEWKNIAKNNFYYLIWGVILYALPYEAILNEARYMLGVIGSYLNLSKKTKQINKIIFMAVTYFVTYCFFTNYLQENLLRFKDGQFLSVIITCLSLVILVKLNRLIKNRYLASLCDIVLIFINGYIVNEMSGKAGLVSSVILIGIICCFVDNIIAKNMDTKLAFLICAAVACLGLLFIELVDYWEEFKVIGQGTASLKGSIILGIWRKTSEVPVICFTVDYIYTQIIATIGIGGVIAFAILFVIMTIAIIYLIIKNINKSNNRSVIAIGVYLVIICPLIYGVFQETGLLPVSSIGIMSNMMNIPLLFLLFRVFNIRTVQYEQIPSFEQLHGLDEDEEIEKLEKEIRLKDVVKYTKLNAKIDILAEHLEALEKKIRVTEEKRDDSAEETADDFKSIREEFEIMESEIDGYVESTYGIQLKKNKNE